MRTKIVVVGDCSVSPDMLVEAAKKLEINGELEIVTLWWGAKNRPEMQKQLLNMEVNGPNAELPPKELAEEIIDAKYLLTHLCPVPRYIIEKANNLKLIGACRGGMEQVDVEAATEKGIPVMHVIRNAEATSDFAIGLMFAETRNIARSHSAIKQGVWRKEYVNSSYTSSLRDLIVGVVGLGHIGRQVAEKLIGYGVKVIGYDPYMTKEKLAELGINQIDLIGLKELFKTSDIVSLHMRVTEETENMIGLELLQLMKPTAYLINTSRAKVLQKNALVKVLQEKVIGGAALDVFWDEPISDSDPLLSLDNITMTSHMAGNVVDALPKSPMLLVKTINDYMKNGKSSMIINKI
jgi:D-3-phosphoglycerate dehydrogenase